MTIEERVTTLEVKQAIQDDRLAAGNAKFHQLEQQRLGPKFWLPFLLALVTAAGGWVWAISKMTTREDVRDMVQEYSPYRLDRDSIRRVTDRYDGDMREIRDSLGSIAGDLKRIDEKLDKPEKGRRR